MDEGVYRFFDASSENPQEYSRDYQKYINNYIKTHDDKPIIFVGLDA